MMTRYLHIALACLAILATICAWVLTSGCAHGKQAVKIETWRPAYDADRDCTVTSEVDRTLTITLTALETATIGQYHYEIELRDTGTDANPATAEAGTLNIVEDLRK